MGMIFIICGLVSALFRSPKATTITVVLSTGVAVSMVIMILCCIFNERDRLSVIWKTRVNAFGLWSILICFIMGVMEIILGVSSITGLFSDYYFNEKPNTIIIGLLHYDDVVERLALHKNLVELAEKYPKHYG